MATPKVGKKVVKNVIFEIFSFAVRPLRYAQRIKDGGKQPNQHSIASGRQYSNTTTYFTLTP